MDWINTPDSSDIKRFAYDEPTRCLYVEFNKGTVYKYHDVSQQVHQDLIDAPSKGTHLHKFIKWNYAFERIPAIPL